MMERNCGLQLLNFVCLLLRPLFPPHASRSSHWVARAGCGKACSIRFIVTVCRFLVNKFYFVECIYVFTSLLLQKLKPVLTRLFWRGSWLASGTSSSRLKTSSIQAYNWTKITARSYSHAFHDCQMTRKNWQWQWHTIITHVLWYMIASFDISQPSFRVTHVVIPLQSC